MKRCFGSYRFVLVVAVLGSLQTPVVKAGDKSSWTRAAEVLQPQRQHFEYSRAKAADPPRQYRWIPEAKIPTPFGYSLTVTSSNWAKNDHSARYEPIALLSPDSAYLAIGSDMNGVQIVDRLKKQKTTSLLPIRQLMQRQPDAARGVQDLAFYRSADKMTLIVADGSKELTLWDVAEGNRLASLTHDQAGDRIAFAPGLKGSLIVAIGSQLRKCDFTLKKWDAQQQKLPAPVIAIAASEYRRVVAVATADRSITLFDGETLKPLQSWKHSDGKIDTELRISLAVSLKGDRVFTATSESQGTVTVWDAKTGKKTDSFTHPNPDGTPEDFLRLTATLDGKVKTQWVTPEGYGFRALLWSPPEGVEFVPPADLWLVHARAVKILDNAKDGLASASEWKILHAYTGDPELKGKSFTLKMWSLQPSIVLKPVFKPDDEAMWWIKRRKAEGDLVCEVVRPRFGDDGQSAFGWAEPSKALATMIEKLNDYDRDSERVRFLVKHALGDPGRVSSWSLWWLETATFRLKVQVPSVKVPSAMKALESEKKSKLIIASEAVEQVAKHAVSANDYYNLACCFSLLVRSTAVESDRESYARRAVKLFEQAIEKGWDNIERIKNDSDLDSLRDRDDFKKLLAVLETRKATPPSVGERHGIFSNPHVIIHHGRSRIGSSRD